MTDTYRPLKGMAIAGFFLLALFIRADAQNNGSLSVRVSYDTSAVAELFNQVPLGLTFTTSGGVTAATRGFLRGRIGWNQLKVTTPQGTVHDGILSFNRKKVSENGHRVSFTIQFENITLASELRLPYVTSIRFNLYTDSLKRDNPFYLNVEGRFSSGRVYPLDTGMVVFKKRGGGVLHGNVLTVTGADTLTKSIRVYARLKLDPTLTDHTVIPVKILADTASLPTEQELLNQWKRPKKRRSN